MSYQIQLFGPFVPNEFGRRRESYKSPRRAQWTKNEQALQSRPTPGYKQWLKVTLDDKLHQHVAATNRFVCTGENLVKIFVSATEFCRSNMLQKIKSDRICVTCRGDKILLQRQKFS